MFVIESSPGPIISGVSWWVKMRCIYTDKKVAILFGDKTSCNIKTLVIYKQRIKWTTKVKYLSVTLYSKLKFNKHITITSTKARRFRTALYPMLTHNTLISIPVNIRIAQMYITTILTYAGTAWRALILVANWIKVEAVLNIAVRTSTGSPWFVRTNVLHRSLATKSIKKINHRFLPFSIP